MLRLSKVSKKPVVKQRKEIDTSIGSKGRQSITSQPESKKNSGRSVQSSINDSLRIFVEDDNDTQQETSLIEKTSIYSSELNITPEELKILQEGTNSIKFPSWISRLPRNIGLPAAGTPKAAEWLVLYTIHVVLVLIPRWKWNSKKG